MRYFSIERLDALQKLKPELKSRGLDTSGKKADLVERLEAYLKSNSAEGQDPAQTGPASSTGDEEAAKPTTTQVPAIHTPVRCQCVLTILTLVCMVCLLILT